MKQQIIQFLQEIGIDKSIIDDNQENRVKKWLDIYQGKAKDHEYFVYDGKKRKKLILKSLAIPYKSCNDLSDFFFNEKLEITTDNKKFNKRLEEIFNQTHFLSNANGLLQLTKALGDGAIVPYLDNGVLKMNFLNATNIIILDADTTGVNSILFYNEENTKDGTVLKINCHVLGEDGYTIYNREYLKVNKAYQEIELDENIKEIHTGSFIKQFAHIYTPEKNNTDIDSPYHISVFENAIDNILAIDRAYDSYDNEVWLGRKRIYVKGGAVQFNTDEQGNVTPIFDSSETIYHSIPGDEKDPLVTVDDSQLRIDQLGEALQSQLNLYTSAVGLGHNYYKFKDGQTYVNTDNVISTNSDIYRKIRKQENILTNAITELCYAIAELTGFKGQFSVSVFYDDSVIEDTEATRKEALTEYNTGLISKAEYFRQVYKLKDNEAKKFVKDMNKEIEEETITDGEEPLQSE